MRYDDSLAVRIREALARRRDIAEKTMFGCVCFLLAGHALVGVWRESLFVRVGADQYEEALAEPHVRVFDITGKPMKGWITVEPEGLDDDATLAGWIERAIAFVMTLPKK
jgi:hypothetical protein